MGEGGNCDIWGLSLSLRPPVNYLDHTHKFKRESDYFLAVERNPRVQNPNKTRMMMPRMTEVKVKSPLVTDVDKMESGKVGSLNSALSSASGKRVARFIGKKGTISDEEESGSGGGGGRSGSGRGVRKKLSLSKEQIMVLEQAFKEHTTLNKKQKAALARQVNLRPRQVEVWFQNRRARTKLKQIKVDCEYLRRFCETITEQNKMLHKEVQELRALKVSPDQSVMHGNHPPTNLSMCPSCKSVSLSSSTSTRTSTSETNCYLADVLHRPVPLNLKKLSLTINNNRMW